MEISEQLARQLLESIENGFNFPKGFSAMFHIFCHVHYRIQMPISKFCYRRFVYKSVFNRF